MLAASGDARADRFLSVQSESCMIINFTHAFIFIHVPKTAGTSASRHLSTFTGSEDIDINSSRASAHWDEFGLRKHTPAQEIQSFLGTRQFERLFKFAFVRNPYERIYSLYKFLKFNWRSWPGSEIMDGFASLESFLQSDFFREATTKESIDDRLLRSQVFWLCDAQGRIMCDFVGRVESFEADFEHICSQLGLPLPDPALEPANVGGRPEFRVSWRNRVLVELGLRKGAPPPPQGPLPSLQEAFASPASRRIVLEHYSEDFTTFGYDTELPRT